MSAERTGIREGSQVRTGDGRRLTLARMLKSGGAGSVYLLGEDARSVAKIYHADIDVALYERKLAAMLELSPQLPELDEGGRRYVQIAWPQSPLRDDRGRFLGFLMPAVDVAATSELELVMQERQARAAKLPTGLGAKITLAANLAAVIAELHRQHHYVVDMKPVNLRFYPRSLYMAMLDCDGFSIQGHGERFPAPQYTIDYLAPEFHAHGITATGEEQQDRFALAVIVFQLLNFGIHPYSGRPASDRVPTDIPGRIAGNWYAYGLRANVGIAANPGSGHAAMPADLRQMFDRAFALGRSLRPSAAEWSDLLRSYAKRSTQRLAVCGKQAAHQHFSGQTCAACARESLLTSTRKQQARAARAAPTTPALLRAGRPGRKPRPPFRYMPTPPRPVPAAPASSNFLVRMIGRMSWKNRIQAVFMIVVFCVVFFDNLSEKSAQSRPYAGSPVPAEIAIAHEEPPPSQTEYPSSLAGLAGAAPDAVQLQTQANVYASLARHAGQSDGKYLASAVASLRNGAQSIDRSSSWSRSEQSRATSVYLSASTKEWENQRARDALVSALQRVLQHDPYAHDIAFELGWMALLDSHRDQARDYFVRALWANSVNPRAWYGLGVTASDDEQMLGAFAIAETLAENDAQAEIVRRQFQFPSIAYLGIDLRRFHELTEQARQMAARERNGSATPP